MTEDEMAGWHHRLDGHGFGCTPRVGDGQGGLACCGSWGLKEFEMTEKLNGTDECSYILCPWADVLLGKMLHGNSLVRTLFFYCRGLRFDPWLVN